MGQSAMQRYHNDSAYKQVVDAMYHMIHTAQFTPSELREAAIVASILYESRTIRSMHIPMTAVLHEQLEEFHKMVNEAKP